MSAPQKKPREQVQVVNISSEKVSFELENTIITMKPREVIRMNPAYAEPRMLQEGRDPVASIIDLYTNGKVLLTTDPRAKPVMMQIAAEQERRV